MDVFEAICQRRSIRSYIDEAIPDDIIEKLLDAARWAPNGSNANAWRFVVVSSTPQKELLLNFIPGIFDMPAAIIVICAEPNSRLKKEIARWTYMADCSIAAQNIMIAAHAMGIGSCVILSYADVALREILELPDSIDPFLILTLGYPSEAPEPPPRKSLNEIAFLNNYGERWVSR